MNNELSDFYCSICERHFYEDELKDGMSTIYCPICGDRTHWINNIEKNEEIEIENESGW